MAPNLDGDWTAFTNIKAFSICASFHHPSQLRPTSSTFMPIRSLAVLLGSPCLFSHSPRAGHSTLRISFAVIAVNFRG